MAPIGGGEAYNIDAAKVHILVVKFITENKTGEMKVKAHGSLRNRCIAWNALKEHYEGIGIHGFDIV